MFNDDFIITTKTTENIYKWKDNFQSDHKGAISLKKNKCFT